TDQTFQGNNSACEQPQAAELIEGAISGRCTCFSQNLLKDVAKAVLLLRVEQPLTDDGNCFGKEVLILPRTPTDEEVNLVERKLIRRALVGHYPVPSCAAQCEKCEAFARYLCEVVHCPAAPGGPALISLNRSQRSGWLYIIQAGRSGSRRGGGGS